MKNAVPEGYCFTGANIIRTGPYQNRYGGYRLTHADLHGDRAVRALSLAIMQPTISGDGAGCFQRLHTLLRQLFPLVFTRGVSETVDGGALLIHLPGRKNARALVFCAHLDVVSAGDPARWRDPPFSGAVRDGYIYGRGAQDMKGHLIALLCAAEELLEEGWQPAGDIWFAFSCDEETRGGSMAAMARLLKSRGVEPAFVLDEGGNVSHPYALTRRDAAYVGVCEKGRLLFSLSCEGAGAMEQLVRAAARIRRIRPRYRLCAPVLDQMLPAMRPLRPTQSGNRDRGGSAMQPSSRRQRWRSTFPPPRPHCRANPTQARCPQTHPRTTGRFLSSRTASPPVGERQWQTAANRRPANAAQIPSSSLSPDASWTKGLS